jgi:branched-chain amino acid transport system permease protein
MLALLTHLIILIAIFGILALGLNLIMGETGLLSIAHAVFYAIGAYGSAILMKTLDINFFLALLLSMVISALFAYLVGLIFSKFRGDYYALATISLNIIVFTVLLNWKELTNGALGIAAIPRPELFGFVINTKIEFLLFSLLCFALVYYICRYIKRSSFGRVLNAIREDEDALSIFGYKAKNFKLAVFVIAALTASLAGSIYASYISFIAPSSFTVHESVAVATIIVIGGLGSNPGVVLGTIIFMLIPEALRLVGFPIEIAAQMRQLVYGLILILLMLYRPRGIMGTFKF